MRIVDGVIIVSCDISGPARRIPVNLRLDVDGAYGLQLHNRAAAPLPAETSDGSALPITLHFPDFTLEVPRRELGDEEAFEEFTKYHSSEIGENALVGALGAQYLRHFSLVLDLAVHRVELRPAGSLTGRAPGIFGDEIVVPLTERNDLAWIPVTLAPPEGEPRSLAMAIGTTNYDTWIDAALCRELRRPAGDVGRLTCRNLDLAAIVALRPEPVLLVHPDGVAGVTGVNLLESLRVEVDRENHLVALAPRRSGDFPAADLAYFRARATEQAAAVQTWLEAHPDARLAGEAAELLLTYRLEEGATGDELHAALQWIHDTTLEDLRATRMLDLMDELFNEGEIDLVVTAGELGIESGRQDRYPDAVHRLHGRLGSILLDRGDDREAWRHLLAAAFGLPEDGTINLDLGRYYERAGRLRRAFSRYIQAVIKEESGAQAMDGLQRIDGRLPEEDRLSLDIIERMIAGKVRNFGAPTMYEHDPTEPTDRTALVEFFTNAHLGDETLGAIGGALGNQGLMTHFRPEDCVFLSYHLPTPRMDPLVNALGMHRAEQLSVGSPVVQIVNGSRRAPGAGRWRDAEGIYDAARRLVTGSFTDRSGYTIAGTARLDGRRVTGDLAVTGAQPEAPLRLEIIVAERGVVFPGQSSVVIHRMVARGSAIDDLDGVPYAPGADDVMRVAFDRDLGELERENEAFLSQLAADGLGAASRLGRAIDGRNVEIIAVLREADSGAVRQAARIDVEHEAATARRQAPAEEENDDAADAQ